MRWRIYMLGSSRFLPSSTGALNAKYDCNAGGGAAGHSQFAGGQGGENGELHCKLGAAVRTRDS
jgi:hypothetical protein